MLLSTFKFITNSHQWHECHVQLKVEPRLAIDLEANSMFAYRESVCLIQISIPGQDYIIDPTINFDLSKLGQIIVDPAVEKIFHAAEYDLILLKRQYGWELNNLFDTMWAARILGYERFGLASLLDDFYQIKLNKQYQRSNWCKRPLEPEQLAYAQHDTHFLFDLRDRLEQELIAKGCMEEAAETFAQQSKIKLNDNEFDPDSFWSINGVRDLSKQQQAALKALNIFRDKEARRRNQPLFKVFNDRTLLSLARHMPVNQDQLAKVHGMSRGQIQRYGNHVVKIINESGKASYPKHPVQKKKRHSEAVITRYEKLRQWRKERAVQRGVESDVILSRAALWEIAQNNPANRDDLGCLESIGAWRCATYGDEILSILNNSSAH